MGASGAYERFAVKTSCGRVAPSDRTLRFPAAIELAVEERKRKLKTERLFGKAKLQFEIRDPLSSESPIVAEDESVYGEKSGQI
jgi:hypothetical protein